MAFVKIIGYMLLLVIFGVFSIMIGQYAFGVFILAIAAILLLIGIIAWFQWLIKLGNKK